MAEQRLINAEELLNEMQLEYAATRNLIEQGEDHLNSLAEGYLEVHQFLKNMPTIDPESLRPVGHWEWKAAPFYICSNCNQEAEMFACDDMMDYCPHCGARMEVQDDD